MDLNLYRVFVQVYESDTLAIASERLHISQSAISHALSRLRQHFDDELFIKEGRTLVATAFARRLYPKIQQAITVLTMATEQTNIDTLIAQTEQLTIAMKDDVELLLLPHIEQAIAGTAPHIQLNSVHLQRDTIHTQLRLGQVDIVIDVARSVADTMYQAPLVNDGFVVLSNYHEKDAEDDLNSDGYLQAHHILVSSRPKGKSLEDMLLVQLGYYRDIALRCQHYGSAVRLLQHSHKPYLLTLPRLLAESLDTTGLQVLSLPITIPDFALHLYWHKEMNNDVLNEWVRRLICLESKPC